MESIHDGSHVNSIISDCGLILGSTENSADTASSSSESLVEASFVNALAFTFLDCKITLIEAMGKVSISPFAY